MMSAALPSSTWVIAESERSRSLLSSRCTGWVESVSKVSGADEAGGRVGHHHADVHARLLEIAQQLGGLVGGDATRDAEEDGGLLASCALLPAECYSGLRMR